MTHDDLKELARCLTTDQLTEAVEQVDPDWVAHFAGDLDRAVGCYIEFDETFQRALEAIADEHAEIA